MLANIHQCILCSSLQTIQTGDSSKTAYLVWSDSHCPLSFCSGDVFIEVCSLPPVREKEFADHSRNTFYFKRTSGKHKWLTPPELCHACESQQVKQNLKDNHMLVFYARRTVKMWQSTSSTAVSPLIQNDICV